MASNFFNKASLVMVPDAPIDGKLPSVKPEDRSGDFTFSRGSNLAATRVNKDGLIEKGRENLLLQSNQFDTTWGNAGTTEIGGQSDKDGGTNAWLLRRNVTNSYLVQTISANNLQTFSIYAKAGTLSWFRILNTSSVGDKMQFFDLQNGVLGVKSGLIDSSINSVGNGWYRCSITYNATTTGVRIYPADGDNDTTGTSGDIYIQDAQLEQGLVASDVITTGASTAQAGILEDMPRLDYSGGASCPSLLLEPQRTNLLTHSEYFGGWTKVNQGTGISPTLSIGGDFPLGDGKYYNLQCDLNGGTTSSDRSYISLSGLSGTQFTAAKSLWIKNNSGSEAVLFAGINFSNDKFTLAANADWQRITIEGGVINSEFRIGLGGGSSNSDSIDVSIFGAQCEEGSYPTSYIPTYGSSVTRGVDNPIISSAGDIVDINQGTLFIDVTIDSNVNTEIYLMKFDGVNFNDTLYLYRSGIGKIQGIYRIGGSAYKEGTTGAISGRLKAAFAYDSNNDCTLYVNGSKIGSSFSIPTPSVNLTAMRLGGFNDALAKQSGGTHQSLYFPTALTDDECIALTTI